MPKVKTEKAGSVKSKDTKKSTSPTKAAPTSAPVADTNPTPKLENDQKTGTFNPYYFNPYWVNSTYYPGFDSMPLDATTSTMAPNFNRHFDPAIYPAYPSQSQVYLPSQVPAPVNPAMSIYYSSLDLGLRDSGL